MPLLFTSVYGGELGTAEQSPTDANFDSVELLMGFEGADESTNFEDESSNNRTMDSLGDAQIDTAQFKFGSSSLLLNGVDENTVFTDDDIAWTFDGEFTVEGFFRPASIGGNQTFVCHWSASSGNRSWLFRMNNDGTVSFFWSFDGSFQAGNVLTSTLALSADTWYHVAVTRDSDNDIRLFIDGTVEDGPATSAGTFQNITTSLRVGSIRLPGSNAEVFDGHMDEVRITKGVARYDSAFTPPDEAFPRQGTS